MHINIRNGFSDILMSDFHKDDLFVEQKVADLEKDVKLLENLSIRLAQICAQINHQIQTQQGTLFVQVNQMNDLSLATLPRQPFLSSNLPDLLTSQTVSSFETFSPLEQIEMMQEIHSIYQRETSTKASIFGEAQRALRQITDFEFLSRPTVRVHQVHWESLIASWAANVFSGSQRKVFLTEQLSFFLRKPLSS